VALFDVFSVLFAKYGDRMQDVHDAPILSAFRSLLDDEDFFDAISYSTNSLKMVGYRFRRTEELIKEVLQ
jgi:hypothetical protein